MHHLTLDRWSHQTSPLHRRDPRGKLLALVALLVALATARQGLIWFSAGVLVMLLGGLVWARISITGALTRGALVLPFVVVFALISWMAGDPVRGLWLLLKSYLSAVAVVLTIATTPLPVLLQAIEKIRAPGFLIEICQFLYRYLFVLVEEVHHLNRAVSSRGGGVWYRGMRAQPFQAVAGALGALFWRSFARAELVHHAMLSRGFTGSMPLARMSRFQAADVSFTCLAVLVPWAMRLAAGQIAR